jgi:surfeit locus 1 family protein
VQTGSLRFRFRWVPALLLALPIPLFVALGVWQLERADQKRALAATLEARAALPPAVLDREPVDAGALEYRQIEARGRLEEGEQILIENRRQGGRTGFHVITPLRIEGSETRVLVNRGFIPATPKGEPTPAPVPAGPVTVHGEGYVPSAPAVVLAGPEEAAVWGERWPYLTVALFASRVAYPVQPLVILQDPADPHGFERSWTREPPKEGMHIGYAIQWFAFALIALVLWLRLSLVREGPDRPGEALR